jgi:hypothetical protein
LGSLDGGYFDQDRFTPISGRLPDPTRADEVAVNEESARRYGYHVGQRIDLGAVSASDAETVSGDQPVRPRLLTHATIVGVGTFIEEVVQDDTDRSPLVAWREQPQRVQRRAQLAKSSARVGALGSVTLPPAMATGLRFAFGPGSGSGSGSGGAPVRSVMASATVAVAALVAAVTFGASMQHLVSDPRLFGWNWAQRTSTAPTLFVRFRPGADRRAALHRLAGVTEQIGDYNGIRITPVQRSAEIVNADDTRGSSSVLSAAIAVSALAALALALTATVRRRRRDLALLKTLGFTRRQLSATIAWQATSIIAVGLAVGVPLGMVLGRLTWKLFARQLDVLAQPAVPFLAIAVIALAATAAANALASLPARYARAVPPASTLRDE